MILNCLVAGAILVASSSLVLASVGVLAFGWLLGAVVADRIVSQTKRGPRIEWRSDSILVINRSTTVVIPLVDAEMIVAVDRVRPGVLPRSTGFLDSVPGLVAQDEWKIVARTINRRAVDLDRLADEFR